MTDISTIVVSALAAVGATDGAQLTMPPHPEFDAMGRAIDELRNEMRRAIDVGEPKRKIVQIFLRASDISAEAAGAEALHKKKKDLKMHAAFREIGLRVDLLRAQSLTDLEKAGRRFMGRPGEGTKIGTPPPPHLITLGDLFPRHSQDQARKLSQDLQLLSKLSLTNFEALVADPTAPRPRSGPEKRLLPLSSIRADEQAQPARHSIRIGWQSILKRWGAAKSSRRQFYFRTRRGDIGLLMDFIDSRPRLNLNAKPLSAPSTRASFATRSSFPAAPTPHTVCRAPTLTNVRRSPSC